MKLCLGCMEHYEDECTICPHCGYEEDAMPAESFHLIPGTVIGDRYIVGKVLGFGGFGVTYIGFDRELEKKVAIKEYLPSEFATRTLHETHVTVYGGDKTEQFGQGMTKFVDEARKLARFSEDTEIVNVYDTFTENGTAYIVMEYLEGESLRALIERKGKLSLKETEDIMIPIFQSLKVVHDAGIIHRDIAPDNIFITKDAKIKLLDFGAARYASATHSRSLTVMYKPGFAPEEQYQSRGEQGPWTDVYALAATMYKCLTGITPDTSLERKIKDNLVPPSKLGISIPKNKETALMNAMNIEVKSRTKSTEAFLEEWESKGEVARIVEHFKKMDAGKLGKKAKIGIIAGAAALVASLAVVIGMGGMSKVIDTIELGAGNARVPSIVNESMDEAIAISEKAGIRIMQADTKYDAKIEKGKVLSQSVEAGKKMKMSDDLLVVVSGGIKQIYVPDVAGNTAEDAIERLKKEGFTCQTVEEYSALAVGNVIRTDCLSGMQCDEGTMVTLFVSKGIDPATIIETEEPIEYEVEDYTNMTITEVMDKLASIGIYLDYSEQMESAEIEKDHIVSQKTPIGTKLTMGDTVSVVVSVGIPMVNVGSVVGWQCDGKAEELEAAGFIVERGEEVYDENSVAGLILAVTTEDGEPVTEDSVLAKGAKLILTISKGPKPKDTKTPTKAPTQAPTIAPTATKAPAVAPTPTKAPTLAPTPTKAPTVTTKPTATPKPTPTTKAEPTVAGATPTNAPTSTNTPIPTNTPTPTPTMAPTSTPAPSHTHKYDFYVSDEKRATCTTDGVRRYYCSCGNYREETIEKYGHSLTNDAAVAATCTTSGKTQGSHCIICGYVYTSQTTIPAKGHTEVIDKAVAATCTETGLTEGKHCSVCNEVIVAQKTIAAKGHTEVVDKAVEATCTETGLTEGKHCKVCDEVLVAQKTVAAKGHSDVPDWRVEATCTTDGKTAGSHCSVCGTVTCAQQIIPATGHNEVTISGKAATCTTSGLTDGKKCSVCGTIIVKQNDIVALGHKFIDDGVKKYCTVCNYVVATWSDWSAWQDTAVGASDTCKVETKSVLSGYEKKTVYKYSRYYGKASAGYWITWPTKTSSCTNYEETDNLDAPLTYIYYQGSTGQGTWGYAKDGNIKNNDRKCLWFNEVSSMIDDTTKPIYKTQYRYKLLQ